MPWWSVRDPADLLQFLDEVHLRVQASCRVGEHQVVVSGIGSLDGIEDDRARVAAFGTPARPEPLRARPRARVARRQPP